MDGLECRELNLLQALQVSNGARIDSHFFEKKYDDVIKLINKHNPILLKSIVSKAIQTGHTPSMKEKKYYNGNIAFIKTDNLRDGYVKTDFEHYLTELGNSIISRTTLQVDDIITTVIGATEDVIARSAIITDELLPSNINQNIVQIRVNKKILEPNYVYVYLNSYYGKNYLYYFSRQMEQYNLNCDEVGSIKIPQFSKEFMSIISDIAKEHNRFTKRSKEWYAEAESIFNDYLQIDYSKFDDSNFSVKTLKNSYNATDRLDAEYYQVRYDELVDKLNKLKAVKLGGIDGICKFIKSIEPGSKYYGDDGIPFIRVSDISKYGIIESEIKIPLNIIDNIEKLYPKKDTILFSKDGSIGIAYKLEEDLKVITSSALLHLHIKDASSILPDYLTLVLNSNVVKMQSERDSNGAIIKHWRMDEISNVLIPIAPIDIQKQISAKIKKSFEMRKQSQELISIGIRAVEIAIEKSEREAINYINTRIVSS